jgi:transposase
MKRFVEGVDRGQSTLFPECLEDWVAEDNPVRVIDAFVDALDLGNLGFSGVDPEATGRPSYHPSMLLKLYIYGYLNRVQSSRRLEREAGRNVEVIADHVRERVRRVESRRRTLAPLDGWLAPISAVD